VAMGFRTYFIQPFKIPTGSMEPTLFGIHSTTGAEPALSDKIPLKFVKWIVTGEWYKEIRITNFGQLSTPCQPARDDPSVYVFYIGNECYRVPGTAIPDDPSICVVYVGDSVSYKVPKDAALNFQPGENVHPGDLLWSGIVTAGDHVFVNKVKWNFQRPKRGQVMVFSTDGIVGLPPQTHYIKRLSGLPNERISINPPNLLVNSTNVTEPRAMRRISNMEPGYAGYSVTGQNSPAMLRQPSDSILLGDSQYLALGDNTMHSFDSRYWGAVPEENLVGPGMFTYWPFSKRWGPIQ